VLHPCSLETLCLAASADLSPNAGNELGSGSSSTTAELRADAPRYRRPEALELTRKRCLVPSPIDHSQVGCNTPISSHCVTLAAITSAAIFRHEGRPAAA